MASADDQKTRRISWRTIAELLGVTEPTDVMTGADNTKFLRGDMVWAAPSAGSGTVTSVAESFTGGLISVAGSPVTTSGTLALTVAGTSGGIPYFSSATTWASSGALTASRIVLGGGAGATPTVLGSLGTTTTLLHGNAAGNPSFSAVVEGDLGLTDITTANVTSTAHGFAPKSGADATTFLNGAATPAYAQVKDADLATTDVTTNNSSSTKHGFAVKSPADATKFLNGAATPAYAQVLDSDSSTSDITTNNASTSKHGFAPKYPNDATKFLDGTGAYTVPTGGTSGATSIESGNLNSGTSKTTGSIASTFAHIVVQVKAYSFGTANRALLVEANSSSTASDYTQANTGNTVLLSTASLGVPTSLVDPGDTGEYNVVIWNYQSARPFFHAFSVNNSEITGLPTGSGHHGYFNAAITTIKFLLSGSGSFDGSGTYNVDGFN